MASLSRAAVSLNATEWCVCCFCGERKNSSELLMQMPLARICSLTKYIYVIRSACDRVLLLDQLESTSAGDAPLAPLGTTPNSLNRTRFWKTHAVARNETQGAICDALILWLIYNRNVLCPFDGMPFCGCWGRGRISIRPLMAQLLCLIRIGIREKEKSPKRPKI